MRIAYLDVKRTYKNLPNSITVAYRNLIELQRVFGGDIICSMDDKNLERTDYDVIICGFATPYGEIEKSAKFINQNNARLYWLVGEYEQGTFGAFNKSNKTYEIIQNYKHISKKKNCVKYNFLNINLLLLYPQQKKIKKEYGCIYYGRWRDDRTMYIKKYLPDNAHLSTTKKNMKKFNSLGIKPKWSESLNLKTNILGKFITSLYIEDEYTHTHYNCPANRYYEALAHNVVLLVGRECKNTFDEANIELHPYQWVSSKEEVDYKTKKLLEDDNLLKELQDHQDLLYKQAVKDRGDMIKELSALILS